MPKLFVLIATIVLLSFNQSIYPFSPESTAGIDTGAHCFYSYRDSLSTHHEVEVQIQSDGITLAGRLFLPDTTGTHPVAIMMHGGGGNVDMLRATPFYFAPRFAHCGMAAFVYDKRGTGDSGGDYSSSTFDDFVNDAGNSAIFLSKHSAIDPERIGIVGFSQGGRLAPVVAVRYNQLSFAVSVSGPLTSAEATRLYALENDFRRLGVSDSVMTQIMPVWNAHFEAIASNNQTALSALDDDIKALRKRVHRSITPPLSTQLPRTGIYNSIGRDYATELEHLNIPWFSLYGADDIIVPVEESLSILHERMEAGGHEDFEIKVIPHSTHSFMHSETREPINFEAMVVDWLLENVISA